MAITITEAAIQKIESIKKMRQTPDACLRISLKSGGCSGFKYEYEFVETPEESDKVFTFNDLVICIDKKSYLFLNGMEIDYKEDLMKSGIVFNNPKTTRTCGCGESITF